MKKVTTSTLLKMVNEKDRIVAITAYDASFAKLFDDQGVDVILIGDSLGMVLKGEDDTTSVTVNEVAYHTKSVRKGINRSLVVADMPFMSYSTSEDALKNAATLMAAGANMVKVEGGRWLLQTIKALVERGVPVCGHLGLTPQSVHVFGGFKVQGKTDAQVEQLLNDAKGIEQAGAQLLVVECIPTEIGKLVSEHVNIPVIGIGAGPYTDGQILVMHDMLGVSANYMPKFSKNYLQETDGDIRSAIKLYIDEVKSNRFPATQHCFEQ